MSLRFANMNNNKSISESQVVSFTDNDDQCNTDGAALRTSYSMPLSMEQHNTHHQITSVSSISPSMTSTANDHHDHPSLRTSKSEEGTATTTTPQKINGSATKSPIRQHKLDRYGFIVNLDIQGNVISSFKEENRDSKDSHVTDLHNNRTAIPHKVGTSGKQESTYSIDTQYNSPTPISRKVTKSAMSTNGNHHTPTTSTNPDKILSTVQQTNFRPINKTKDRIKKNYVMQRRRKQSTISDAARITRRTMKWDTMIHTNVPATVISSLQQNRDRPKHEQLDVITTSSDPVTTTTDSNNSTIRTALSSTVSGGNSTHKPLLIVWNTFNKKYRQYHTLKRRLRKGIPNQEQRAIIWPILCHVPDTPRSPSSNDDSNNIYRTLLIISHQIQVEHEQNEVLSNNDTSYQDDCDKPGNFTKNMGTSATKINKKDTVEDTTKIEMNYTKSSHSTISPSSPRDGQHQLLPPAILLSNGKPIKFQYTKSFRSTQDTIERDLHRTFPRHCMFYSEDNDDDHENEDACDGDANEVTNSTTTDHSNILNARNGIQTSTSDRNENCIADDATPNSEDNNDRTTAADDDHYSIDTSRETIIIQQQQQSNGGICGTNEISNLIRELDLVPSSLAKTSTRNEAVNAEWEKLPLDTGAENTSIDGKDHDGTANDNFNSATESNLIKDHSSIVYADTSNGNSSVLVNSSDPASHDHIFDGVGGQSRLRRVLKAYSVYDREIGYCQGMNFIAAMFLTLVEEEYAFWMLVAVMHEEPCHMRGMFAEGMKGTHQALYVAEKLIHHFLPKLAKHFDKESIHVTMFATQWLLTQFTSSFRFDLVTRLWDCFLFEGWKATYRVMLALLQRSQSDLLLLGFEDILAYFRELPDRPDIDGTIVDDSLKIPLKTIHIRKYEMEWLAQRSH